MGNSATNINEKLFQPVPSKYLVFQRYMSWSLLYLVILKWEVAVCFVDINGIVDHHGLSFPYIMTSHIESLNIKRIID